MLGVLLSGTPFFIKHHKSAVARQMEQSFIFIRLTSPASFGRNEAKKKEKSDLWDRALLGEVVLASMVESWELGCRYWMSLR